MYLKFIYMMLGFRAILGQVPEGMDETEYVIQIRRELQRAAGYDDAQMQKYMRTLRNMNRLGELTFLGRTTGLDPPNVLNVTEEELLSPASAQFFEGDIILTPTQMDELVHSAAEAAKSPDVFPHKHLEQNPEPRDAQPRAARQKRKLTSSSVLRWTFPIQYTVARGTDASAVEAGLNLWRENTCVRFNRVFVPYAKNYIDFIRGSGCFSNIGMVGGRQTISIGFGCGNVGTVAHEIGHALGFWHEQSRPDRDDHVKIVADNVQPGTLGNFLPRDRDDVSFLRIPYDLGSVMHYGPTAFANKLGANTIETLNPDFQTTLGQREALSFYDIKFINFGYKCNELCSTQLPCHNYGYTDPKDCTKCRCPDGTGGRLCQAAAKTATDCGAINLAASSYWKMISQLGTGYCSWMIKAPIGTQVLMEIQEFTFQFRGVTCTRQFLEFKTSKDLGNTGARLCVGSQWGSSFKSDGPVAVVIYKGIFSSRFSLRYRYAETPKMTSSTAFTTTTATEIPPTEPTTAGSTTTTIDTTTTTTTEATTTTITTAATTTSSTTTATITTTTTTITTSTIITTTTSATTSTTTTTTTTTTTAAITTTTTTTTATATTTTITTTTSTTTATSVTSTTTTTTTVATTTSTTETVIMTTAQTTTVTDFKVGTSTAEPSTTRSPLLKLTGFSAWTAWSSCSNTCGACGTQGRARFCFSRAAGCQGGSKETRACDFQPCPGVTPCCSPYKLRRNQWCDLVQDKVPQLQEAGSLMKSAETTTLSVDSTESGQHTGKVPASTMETVTIAAHWNQWTDWSVCGDRPCGGCGVTMRSRSCSDGMSCVGSSLERRACGFDACEDCSIGPIVDWGPCGNDTSRSCPIRQHSDKPCPCCAPFRLIGRLCVLY